MRTLALMALCATAAVAQSGALLPPSGNVALPLDDYNRLIELAARPAVKNVPPVPFVIRRADVNLQVTGAKAQGTVQLQGQVLQAGTVRVPLFSGMTVLEARAQGGALPLMWDGRSHAAALTGPSEFDITLDVGMTATVEPGRASLTIPAPAAGAVRLTLSLAGDRTNVTLSSGVVTSRVSNAGKTTVEATLTGGQSATVSWATREAAAPAVAPKEARFLADVKSLVTIGDAAVSVAALSEITVLQGEPAQFSVSVPKGWEVTGATGATLQSSDMRDGALLLSVKGTERAHAFLITMETPVSGTKVEIPALGFAGAARETGETVVEGEGAMELTAKESGGMTRMDVKEASAYLRGMARQSVQAAFRYHRQPGATPSLDFEWTRFPNSSLPAAVAENAAVTTLVTGEGRTLTEVTLTLRNREQPFLRVSLPPGASIVSADVAGQAVKPAQGADGARVPLLRAGFRPTDAYRVSFVMMHAGAPFAQKGGGNLSLPKMDVPIALLDWEVFLPQRYRVTDFHGDALAASLLPRAPAAITYAYRPPPPPAFAMSGGGGGGPRAGAAGPAAPPVQTGMIGGYVSDPSGGAVPGAQVIVTHELTGRTMGAATDASGRWAVAGIPPGAVRVEVRAPGFRVAAQRGIEHRADRPTVLNTELSVGAVTESVEVMASAKLVQTENSQKQDAAQLNQASANVANLQRRVAGVLPIPIEVPRAGNSYRFSRPLVVDEETQLTFNYRRTGR